MTNRLRRFVFPGFIVAILAVFAQAQDGKQRGAPKPVTVPISIRLRGGAPTEMRFIDFLLREDGDVQQEVSRRTPFDSPMTLAVLFQDDLVSAASVDMR